MPTISEIFATIKAHEQAEKTASVKKEAIANPTGGPGADVIQATDNVLGGNVAETKVKIKQKLDAVAGKAMEAAGLSANADVEKPQDAQKPILGDKMPPGGDMGAGLAAKVSAFLNAKGATKVAEPAKAAEAKKATETAEAEKTAEEKLAEEYYAGGQIMAQGFVHELNRLMSSAQ
jgi:hypothetical protein